MYSDILKYCKKEDLTLFELDSIPYTLNLENFSVRLYADLLNAETIGIYGDYDVDGLMCNCIMTDITHRLCDGIVSSYKYQSRTHKLDKLFALECIQRKYDVVIVTDTGSSVEDLVNLTRIAHACGSVFVIDHHAISLRTSDLPENVYLLNTTLEKATCEDYECLSAGGLCLCVASKLAEIAGLHVSQLSDIYCYAIVSLYADCMHMNSKLNRFIWKQVSQISCIEYPPCISVFLKEGGNLTARTVQFNIAPKLNACFRAESFWAINALFLERDVSDPHAMFKEIKTTYEESKPFIELITDVVSVAEYESLVFCNLTDYASEDVIQEKKLYNYTGLIANKLAERYKRTCIVICRAHNAYKGSVRCYTNIDALSITSNYCTAGGHPSAHGFELGIGSLAQFIDSLVQISAELSYATEVYSDVIVDTDHFDARDMRAIATYNEFAHNATGFIRLRCKLVGDFKEAYTKYGYRYEFHDTLGFVSYVTFKDYRIPFGSTITVTPYLREYNKIAIEVNVL